MTSTTGLFTRRNRRASSESTGVRPSWPSTTKRITSAVCNAEFHLGVHLLGKVRVHVASDAAGIDDRKRVRAQPALRDDAVPGDAGLIVDDGNLPARQPVEEGGFADFRAADNRGSARGDGRSWRGWHGVPAGSPEPASDRPALARCKDEG